jgi:hypothetical protein
LAPNFYGSELEQEGVGQFKAARNRYFISDVQGSVVKSTHAGFPWLRFIRQRLGQRVHF